MNIVIPSGADDDNVMPRDATNSLQRTRSVLNYGHIQASVEGLLAQEDACVHDSVRKNLPRLDGDHDGVVTSDEVAVAFVQTARDAVNQERANAARERAQEQEAARMARTNKHLTWFAGALVFVCTILAGTTFLTGWASASLAQPTKASTDGVLVNKKDGRELSTHTAVDTFVLRQPDPQELERRRLECTQATANVDHGQNDPNLAASHGSSQTLCNDIMTGSALGEYTLMGNHAEALINACSSGHSVKVKTSDPTSTSTTEYQICGNCMPHMYSVTYGGTAPSTDGQAFNIPKLQTTGGYDGSLTVQPQDTVSVTSFSKDGKEVQVVDLSNTEYTLTGSMVCPSKCKHSNACMIDSVRVQDSDLDLIGCGSCNGDNSCQNPPQESSGSIGYSSCNGDYSCQFRNGFSIGNNSCNGSGTCVNLKADVPDGACKLNTYMYTLETYQVAGFEGTFNCYNS